MNSQRERKRRLVYLFWAVLAVLVILGALPSTIGNRWPRPLAHDHVYLVVHRSSQAELMAFTLGGATEPESRPWGWSLLVVPPVPGFLRSAPGALWELSGEALVKRSVPALTEQRRIVIEHPLYSVVITPDGRQLQLLFDDRRRQDGLGQEGSPSIGWVDAASGAMRQSPTTCEASPRLLPPLRQDEAIVLCASELWAVRPDGQRPLLTTKMEGSPCYGYAGRPFGVGREPDRQRLLLTGDGGALCQIDLRTDRASQIGTLPIPESDRVPLDGLQLAPASNLLYVGITPWDQSSEPLITRILAWDLKAGKLRTEIIPLTPLVAFRPTSDGAHLVGLAAIPPGEDQHRLLLIDVATKTVTEIGRLPWTREWAVMSQQ